MKTFFTIIYFFSLFYCAAQNNIETKGKIIYETKINLGKPITEQYFLFFNEYKSIFTQDKKFKPLEKDIPKYDEEIEVKTDVTPYHLFDFEKDSIFSHSLVFTTPYFVADKIYKPKWQIVKEYKTIGNYNCQKATTAFRGRNYQAWFCEAIPVNFGPWKFNGLPGLILEIEDELKVLKITATSIDIGATLDFDFSTKSIPKKGKRISMKEFVVLKDNESSEIMQYVISKQDRNAEIEIVDPPKKRKGLELTYEWEQNEKK